MGKTNTYILPVQHLIFILYNTVCVEKRWIQDNIGTVVSQLNVNKEQTVNSRLQWFGFPEKFPQKMSNFSFFGKQFFKTGITNWTKSFQLIVITWREPCSLT